MIMDDTVGALAIDLYRGLLPQGLQTLYSKHTHQHFAYKPLPPFVLVPTRLATGVLLGVVV